MTSTLPSLYTVYTQRDVGGRMLSILYFNGGIYGIQQGGTLLPRRWDNDHFVDCVREYSYLLGVPLNLLSPID